ncbi:MAG: DUF2065 domain-containing protein [Methylobacillus glycogenes]|nr:DUF2065 domain-containing protein [Methylobacillus glycogenes]
MSTSTLLLAIGLVLVIEGILPLVSPQAWKQTFSRMVEMKDGQLRFVGLASMIIGLVIVLLVQ